MFTYYIAFCVFISIQETWSAPLTRTVSAGETLSEDFKNNFALMMNNLQAGASNLASKPVVFGVDILPNIIAQGSKTAADKYKKITDANKEALGKLAVGTGHVIGGGGVLVSTVAGEAMNIAGSGLGSLNNIIASGAKAGIDFSGLLGDKAASGIEIGGTLGNSALTAIGDGLTAAGGGTKIIAQAMSDLITAIESKSVTSIEKAFQAAEAILDKSTKLLGDTVISGASKAQVQYYTIMSGYLEICMKLHSLFRNMVVSSATNAAINGDVTATTTSGAAAVTNN